MTPSLRKKTEYATALRSIPNFEIGLNDRNNHNSLKTD